MPHARRRRSVKGTVRTPLPQTQHVHRCSRVLRRHLGWAPCHVAYCTQSKFAVCDLTLTGMLCHLAVIYWPSCAVVKHPRCSILIVDRMLRSRAPCWSSRLRGTRQLRKLTGSPGSSTRSRYPSGRER